MSLFDLLVADACGFVWLCLLFVAHYARQRQRARVAECDAYDLWADELHRWTEPDALVGEVLTPVVDELGTWFPDQHTPVAAHLFDVVADLRPVNLSWRPAWATPTGAWATVGAHA